MSILVWSIDIRVLYNFHKRFWKLKTAVQERDFLQKCMTINTIKRRRVAAEERTRGNRDYVIDYFIQTNETRTRVCKESFLSVLSIGRTKAENAAKTFFDETKETHGGQKPVLQELHAKIVELIRTFRVRERHYGCNATVGRMYLPAELNIKRMHELFLQAYPDHSECKYNFYYEVFRKNFNICFGKIRKDTCSICEQTNNMLQNSDDFLLKKIEYYSKRINGRKTAA